LVALVLVIVLMTIDLQSSCNRDPANLAAGATTAAAASAPPITAISRAS